MNKKHKYNIVVILTILLAFLTINLSNISTSNSITNDISTTIDYENTESVEETKIVENTNEEKITQEDLLILAIGIINVLIISSLAITTFKLFMKEKKIRELPEYFFYIVVLLSIAFFVTLYLKMNESNVFLTIIITIDIVAFTLDTFILEPKLKKVTAISGKEGNTLKNSLENYKDITLGQASEFGINNVISLKQEIFRVCNDINNAYMNFDKKELKELCTKELYDEYLNELDELKNNESKWVVDKINYNDCKITSINKEDKILIIKAILKVSMIDYVLKEDKVTKGNKTKEKQNIYELELIKSSIIRKALKCPNCGQSLKTTGSDKCPYCKQIIVSIGDDLVLNKKKKIKNK